MLSDRFGKTFGPSTRAENVQLGTKFRQNLSPILVLIICPLRGCTCKFALTGKRTDGRVVKRNIGFPFPSPWKSRDNTLNGISFLEKYAEMAAALHSAYMSLFCPDLKLQIGGPS
jgi:hypothetical protein